MKLYELTAQMKELNDMADDPEMAQSVADTLEGMDMQIQEKAENIMNLVANRGADIEAIDSEIKRLTARKKQINSFQDNLRDYLRHNMEAMDIKKIECPLFTITLVKGREIAVIDDEDALPDDFVKVEVKSSPDKNAISAALKDGKEVPGSHLERAKSSIRIK